MVHPQLPVCQPNLENDDLQLLHTKPRRSFLQKAHGSDTAMSKGEIRFWRLTYHRALSNYFNPWILLFDFLKKRIYIFLRCSIKVMPNFLFFRLFKKPSHQIRSGDTIHLRKFLSSNYRKWFPVWHRQQRLCLHLIILWIIMCHNCRMHIGNTDVISMYSIPIGE